MSFKLRPFLLSTLLSLIGLLAPADLRAQFLGYTSPQTLQQTLATNVSCTGVAQNFVVSNLGQIQHSAVMTNLGSSLTNLSMAIQGSTDGVNFVNISDVTNGTLTAAAAASGYYPVVRVQVICGPTGAGVNFAFSLSYSGIAGLGQQSTGIFLTSQVDKQIAFAASAQTAFANSFQSTPYGSAAGVLNFLFSNTAPAGTTLSVICKNASGNFGWQTTFPLATAATMQSFYLPPVPCQTFQVSYAPNGATAVTFQLDYLFSQPGSPPTAFQGTNITTTTATAVKATSGFLHTVTVNTGAAGTIILFDLSSASCTGTPATNQKATITATATTLQTFTYDMNFVNGICVKASVAMDITVSAN